MSAAPGNAESAAGLTFAGVLRSVPADVAVRRGSFGTGGTSVFVGRASRIDEDEATRRGGCLSLIEPVSAPVSFLVAVDRVETTEVTEGAFARVGVRAVGVVGGRARAGGALGVAGTFMVVRVDATDVTDLGRVVVTGDLLGSGGRTTGVGLFAGRMDAVE